LSKKNAKLRPKYKNLLNRKFDSKARIMSRFLALLRKARSKKLSVKNYLLALASKKFLHNNNKVGYKKPFNNFNYSLLKRGFVYNLGQNPVENNRYLGVIFFTIKSLVITSWCMITKKFINIRINKLLKFFTSQKNSDIKLLVKVAKPLLLVKKKFYKKIYAWLIVFKIFFNMNTLIPLIPLRRGSVKYFEPVFLKFIKLFFKINKLIAESELLSEKVYKAQIFFSNKVRLFLSKFSYSRISSSKKKISLYSPAKPIKNKSLQNKISKVYTKFYFSLKRVKAYKKLYRGNNRVFLITYKKKTRDLIKFNRLMRQRMKNK